MKVTDVRADRSFSQRARGFASFCETCAVVQSEKQTCFRVDEPSARRLAIKIIRNLDPQR